MRHPAARHLRIPAVVLMCITVLFAPVLADANETEQHRMQIMRTSGGTRFALFGEVPDAPRPTLIVLAAGLELMDSTRIYTEAGRQLAEHGWLYVAIDPPCHGEDQKPDEPAALDGWAHRVANGEPLVEPFTQRCTEVLDHLIAMKYTDPAQVAACGTSRGGFCALHFAAAEPRIRAVAAVSPVTNLLALREFNGLQLEQVEKLNVASLGAKLVRRRIWISIGNHDDRVNTDDCIHAARQLVAASKSSPDAPDIVPVELIVGPSDGHHAIENAYGLAAEFLLKNVQ